MPEPYLVDAPCVVAFKSLQQAIEDAQQAADDDARMQALDHFAVCLQGLQQEVARQPDEWRRWSAGSGRPQLQQAAVMWQHIVANVASQHESVQHELDSLRSAQRRIRQTPAY